MVKGLAYWTSRLDLLGPKPSFDRDGNVVKGLAYWTSLLFGLGGSSSKGCVGEVGCGRRGHVIWG